MPLVSLVVSEGERALAPFRELAAAHPDLRFELVVVRDGPAAGAPVLDGVRPGEVVRVATLARAFGAYATLCAGLAVARGDAVLVLDPARPDTAAPLLAAWRAGRDVVWAEPPPATGLRALARRVPGLPVTPGERRPSLLVDRAVLDAVHAGPRPRDVVAAIGRAGQRQVTVGVAPPPERALPRRAWRALGWLAGLYSAPFLVLLLVGLAVAVVGALAGTALVALAVVGPAKDWALVVAAVLFVGGLNVATLGGFGEYLWRTGGYRERPGYVLAGVRDQGPPPDQA